MTAWKGLLGGAGPARATPPPAKAAEYHGLHTYLRDRYADVVVLTFGQIEDLLGFALPALARLQREWWADRGADDTPSTQARSWIDASRTAMPNLVARTVTFERAPA